MSAEAEQTAVAAVEAVTEAWSAGDIEAVRATLNYPHVSLFPGHVELRATPEDFESPFERLRETQSWHRSTLDRADVIWSHDDKVYVDAHWSRYLEDGSHYLSGNIVYIVRVHLDDAGPPATTQGVQHHLHLAGRSRRL